MVEGGGGSIQFRRTGVMTCRMMLRRVDALLTHVRLYIQYIWRVQIFHIH